MFIKSIKPVPNESICFAAAAAENSTTNDTLRRFQERDKGYYVPPETLGVLPRGEAQ
jgi:hypothetical protein